MYQNNNPAMTTKITPMTTIDSIEGLYFPHGSLFLGGLMVSDARTPMYCTNEVVMVAAEITNQYPKSRSK